MFLSASRRTDLPACYSDWFLNRVRAGFVLVRNPRNPHQVSRISLRPESVDGIVFWTKNPAPMLDRLDELRDYTYYFQFTVNGYGTDAERGLPDRQHVILPAFRRLSDRIGPERVLWRYDPIFLSKTYPMEFHIRCFEALAEQLSPYTGTCTISFLDDYRHTAKRMAALSPEPFPPERQALLAKRLAEIAHRFGLRVETCAEKLDLRQYGIGHASCIDGRRFERLLGCPLDIRKDPGQRAECGCMESIDIGAYNTCRNGCLYCYANHSPSIVRTNTAGHHPASPLLTGETGPEDRITERKMPSRRTAAQLRFPL